MTIFAPGRRVLASQFVRAAHRTHDVGNAQVTNKTEQMMSERRYKEAVVYCVEVDLFQDSDGDGCGDLPGLTSRLDYLARLGVTCLWLNPIHPSPQRDNGYDISDYYGIDARLGTLGDFTELAAEARERGIRLLLDLVVNHTSDQHPWFQSARSDPRGPDIGAG
jgi:maltose alpha-D-glucosyltransferase/alpha-amylase